MLRVQVLAREPRRGPELLQAELQPRLDLQVPVLRRGLLAAVAAVAVRGPPLPRAIR
jgi:hypothetical protein